MRNIEALTVPIKKDGRITLIKEGPAKLGFFGLHDKYIQDNYHPYSNTCWMTLYPFQIDNPEHHLSTIKFRSLQILFTSLSPETWLCNNLSCNFKGYSYIWRTPHTHSTYEYVCILIYEYVYFDKKIQAMQV